MIQARCLRTQSPLQQFRHQQRLTRWDLAERVCSLTREHPAVVADLIAQIEEGILDTSSDGSIRLLFSLLYDDGYHDLRLRQVEWYGRRKLGVKQ